MECCSYESVSSAVTLPAVASRPRVQGLSKNNVYTLAQAPGVIVGAMRSEARDFAGQQSANGSLRQAPSIQSALTRSWRVAMHLDAERDCAQALLDVICYEIYVRGLSPEMEHILNLHLEDCSLCK